MKRTIVLTVLTFLLSFIAISPTSLNSMPMEPSGLTQNTVVIRRANAIIWKYKIINGHLWKRKYNVTTQTWIGDWILVK